MTEENAVNILSVLAEIWEREHNQRIQSLVFEKKREIYEQNHRHEHWPADLVGDPADRERTRVEADMSRIIRRERRGAE